MICVILNIVLAAVFAAPACADDIRKMNKKANRLYEQGKYEEALKLYDDALLLDPSDDKLKMNRGSALYKTGNLDEAEEAYTDALAAPKDKKTAADAYYNLGNIQFRQGEQLEAAGSAAEARGKYSQALENYINTLKMRPNDKDAKWNLQLAHRKVNMLENQEDRQQRQNQDDQENKDGQDEKEDQSGNDEKEDNNEQQQQEQQEQNQDEQEMKEEEAKRLIEQYADDSDSLNKPMFRRGTIRQPEKDW